MKEDIEYTENIEYIKSQLIEKFSNDSLFDNSSVILLSEYKKIFNNPILQKLLQDDQIIKTVNLIVENNLKISLASKAGYMHRNTIIYRLDKLQDTIGLDARSFKDASVFLNFIRFYETYKKEL